MPQLLVACPVFKSNFWFVYYLLYNVIIIETKAYKQKIYRNRDNYEVREKYTIFKESK